MHALVSHPIILSLGDVDTIFKALPRLGHVMLLVAFVGCVFAVLGMQLFKGSMRHRKRLSAADTQWSNSSPSLSAHDDAM